MLSEREAKERPSPEASEHMAGGLERDARRPRADATRLQANEEPKEKNMRKFIIAAVTVATLAVPAVSMAAAPSGDWNWNTSANSQGNVIGVDSSQIKQNGQFVSGHDNAYGIDQTTNPGSRAAIVQQLLGHTS
jgi:hypothetical protein